MPDAVQATGYGYRSSPRRATGARKGIRSRTSLQMTPVRQSKEQAGNVDPAEVAWKQAAAVWGAKGRSEMPA